METNQNLETVLPMLKWAISQNLYCDINAGSGRIEFSCQAKSYKNVHDFVRLFKTKLIKSQSGTGGCLDYTFINDELTIKLYA